MKYLSTLFAILGIVVMATPSFALTPEEIKSICSTEVSKTDVSVALAALRDGEKITIGGVTYKKVGSEIKVVIE